MQAPTLAGPRAVFEARLARTYHQAIGARAAAEGMTELAASAAAQVAAVSAEPVGRELPMARLARRLGLGPAQIDLVWAIVACSVDGRLVPHLEALGGAHARRGLSLAVHAMLTGLDDLSVAALASWLASPNPLVDTGLVNVAEPASPAARAHAASSRLVEHLTGEDDRIDPLRLVRAPAGALHDPVQRAAIDDLRGALDRGRDAVIVVEGPLGSGRATAAACARRGDVMVLDAARLGPAQLESGLVALARESLLRPELPVLANIDHTLGEGARDERRLIGGFLDRLDGPLVVTTTVPGVDLGTRRPLVRIAWAAADTAVRIALWTRAVEAAGATLAGDISDLAHRYRVGPAAIERAVASVCQRRAPGAPLDEPALLEGLRHNIAEQLGGLAHPVAVTQTWDDLVISEDTADLIVALVGRVRHAHQVLDQWGYRKKIARGTGVAALFSGPPGTGKTMVAGLIARELGLELYQVDLSKVVSKWVGETEKNLARIFDGAEQGHALLLFDEADALFGQRSASAASATDRYANLEVNYLLQRIEAFGGITILTTNMDSAIDGALKRRLAAHIVFATPDEDERAALWEHQIDTGAAPIARDVDHVELARAFPSMSGANIRNAALSAAFLAAAAGAPQINHEYLVRAARAEYRSMGHMVSEVMRPRSIHAGRS
ncbi:MAG TPA: ATP-binding protein [Kofleriaceae bacterium]|nr:ATP-binding protein [Kofleriaceae bacterium]